MTPQHHLPADIERTSLSIITAELEALGLTPPPETAAVVKRVIHTTADFDYARNLRFTSGAVAAGVAALQAAAPIVTDTNMALSGITKPGLARLGGTALCYMADPEVAALAKANGTTRAMEWPPARMPPASATFSAPPRRISPRMFRSMLSGKQTRFSAVFTSPPMA